MSTPPNLALPAGVSRISLALSSGPLAALEARPADGSPTRAELICVPGFTGSKEDFLPLLVPLTRAGIRVLAIDQRGQCDSPALPATRGYTLRGYGADLRELITQRAAAAAARPHLLAHSLGGYVARQALLDEPALPLASVTLLGTGPGAVPRPAADRVRLFLAVSSVMSPVRGNRLLRLDRHRDPGVQEFIRHRIRGNDTRALREMARWLLREPDRVEELAAALRRDTLACQVVCGADERTWRVPEQRRMAERLGVPFTAIPGGGHSVNVEQPELLARALLEFWAAVREDAVQESTAQDNLLPAGAVRTRAVLDGPVLDGAVREDEVPGEGVLDGAAVGGPVLDGAVPEDGILNGDAGWAGAESAAGSPA